MRKTALTVAILMVATAPALAAAKKKKATAKPAAETVQKIDSNEASWRLVKGSLPIFLPSWSMPIYMKMHGEKAYQEEQQQQQAATTKRKKKAQ
jgi:hypothetical protein